MKIAMIISQPDINGVASYASDLNNYMQNTTNLESTLFVLKHKSMSLPVSEFYTKLNVVYIEPEHIEDAFEKINNEYTHLILHDTLNIKLVDNENKIHERFLECWKKTKIKKLFIEHNAAKNYFNNLSYWH